MSESARSSGRDVYIVDGARTPFLKAKGQPGPFSGSDLAVGVGKSLLKHQPFLASDLGEVVIGSTMPSPDEANIARVIAMRLGCGPKVPAFTVMRNCASGMQALDNAAQDIATGRHELVLAGGTDAMSRAPLLFSDAMVHWLAKWYAAKSLTKRLKLLTQFKPGYLAPVLGLLRGLTDSVVGMNMGQTAEKIAYRFGITREEMDQFSNDSHLKYTQALEQGYYNEIVPIFDNNGNVYDFDDGVRRDSSFEKLAKLKPFFDKPYGKVTPGNSSQITDGAALLLLASKEAVKRYHLPVLGRIQFVQWAGLDPTEMGLGPVHAITPLLKANKLKLDDIDQWEINEAFAAQVLACFKAWEDAEYCRDHLGLEQPLGEIKKDRVNVDGGAVAIGHPVGASGARITLHLLHTLKRNQGRYGVASLCIGGGQGGAILVENVAGVL